METATALGLGGLALGAGLVAAALLAARWLGGRAQQDAEAGARLAGAMEQVARSQVELGGRLQQLHETVEGRLDSTRRELAEELSEGADRTGQTLAALSARLAVVDEAQRRIEELADEMVGLQDILANKQARGRFGEVQLERLVADCLPPSAYQFQATLGNGRRADCLLRMPRPPGDLVVDAKFPLESYRALVAAEGDVAVRAASREFAAAVKKHIADIAERYLVPGETADCALLFLPSEAIFAELHARFPAVVEESYRARVFIVSPTTFMATLHTMRAALRDARMREEAGRVQHEVRALLEEVRRLDERFGALERRIGQLANEVHPVRRTVDNVARMAQRIGEAGEPDASDDAPQQPSRGERDAPSPGNKAFTKIPD